MLGRVPGKKLPMEVVNKKLVTAPGGSDTQVPASAGGSGVKAGSTVAGPPRSLSCDRESTEVGNQASDTLSTTGRSSSLSIGSGLSTPPPPGEAELLHSLLDHVAGLAYFISRNRNVHRVIKYTVGEANKEADQLRAIWEDKPRETRESTSLGTQTPCWWDLGGGHRECHQLREFEKEGPSMVMESAPGTSSTVAAPTVVENQSPCGRDSDGVHRVAVSDRRKESSTVGLETTPNFTTGNSWVDVVKRRRKANQSEARSSAVPAIPATARKRPSQEHEKNKAALVRRRIPRTSAVIIDRPTGDGVTLLSVMKRVTREVNLQAIGVQVQKVKTSKTGGIILELDDAVAAARLAEELRSSAKEEARVRLPVRRTPVLLVGVPEWCTTQDVEDGLLGAGLAREDFLREGSPTIVMRKNTGGRGDVVARVDVPHAAALKLHGARTVGVGWTKCKVKLLEKKELTCYRCRCPGHYAVECKTVTEGEADEVERLSFGTSTGPDRSQEVPAVNRGRRVQRKKVKLKEGS